eukprot:1138699-Pelagomonas_calceolata.AAC.1
MQGHTGQAGGVVLAAPHHAGIAKKVYLPLSPSSATQVESTAALLSPSVRFLLFFLSSFLFLSSLNGVLLPFRTAVPPFDA